MSQTSDSHQEALKKMFSIELTGIKSSTKIFNLNLALYLKLNNS